MASNIMRRARDPIRISLPCDIFKSGSPSQEWRLATALHIDTRHRHRHLTAEMLTQHDVRHSHLRNVLRPDPNTSYSEKKGCRRTMIKHGFHPAKSSGSAHATVHRNTPSSRAATISLHELDGCRDAMRSCRCARTVKPSQHRDLFAVVIGPELDMALREGVQTYGSASESLGRARAEHP